MGRLEKKLLGRGDSRNKGPECGEGVYTGGPVAEKGFQGCHGEAVILDRIRGWVPPFRAGYVPPIRAGGRKESKETKAGKLVGLMAES